MEKLIGRMLRRDVSVILGFAVFAWVTICFLISAILAAAGHFQTKCIIVAIGVVTLCFASLSLLTLLLHLRRNRDEIYTEELCPPTAAPDGDPSAPDAAAPAQARVRSEENSHGLFVKVFDILFIMLLCFATLLATMLLRGKPDAHQNIYAVGIISAPVTVIGFTVYFIYLLRHSNRQLRVMVSKLYAEDEKPERPGVGKE